MQGRFVPGVEEIQWCERGLLARMHRYTIKDLRAAIQPVSAADYLRFLVRWQHLEERLEGEAGLAAVIYQLEGFPVPAAAWEQDILPLRIQGYISLQLDRLCSSGQVLWLRLHRERVKAKAGGSKAGLLRNSPITLLGRESQDCWYREPPGQESRALSSSADRVRGLLLERGASFFADLVRQTGMLRTQVEEVLAELAACGLVTSDSFSGLRALIATPSKRPGYARPYHATRRHDDFQGIDSAGRWSLVPPPQRAKPPDNSWLTHDIEVLEPIAWTLLQRYGVVFRMVLTRENSLPPWRELLYVFRRMEARGEIRGGRFVGGFSGEQFALPEAVTLLRAQRNAASLPDIVISAADPLNLVGILLPGERIPAVSGNRILLRNGLPVAKQLRREIHHLQEFDTEQQIVIRELLTRRRRRAG